MQVMMLVGCLVNGFEIRGKIVDTMIAAALSMKTDLVLV